MVFHDTFNNILIILWRLVPWENKWSVGSYRQIVSLNFVSSTPHHERYSNSQCKWW